MTEIEKINDNEKDEITKYAIAISTGLIRRYEYYYLVEHPDEFARDVFDLAEALYDRRKDLYD